MNFAFLHFLFLSHTLSAEAKTYLSFHACHQSQECHNPQNHRIYIAEGINFKNWKLLPGIGGIPGSVPDVVKRGDYLYIYHTPNRGIKYDLKNKQVVKKFNVRVTNSSGQIVNWVDPTALLSSQQNIALMFMMSSFGGDPARCQPQETQGCTKKFVLAKEVANTDGEEFHIVEGSGINIQLLTKAPNFESTIASDPDLLISKDGSYVLLVSRGQSVGAYIAQDMVGPFRPMSTQEITFPRIGGVPASVYSPEDKQFYTFTTSRDHQSGNGEMIMIYRHSGWSTEDGPKNVWATITGNDFPELGANYSVSSPGIER